MGPWDPLNGNGDNFLGGHPYYLSESNDFSEKIQDLKSVSQCPFKGEFLDVIASYTSTGR